MSRRYTTSEVKRGKLDKLWRTYDAIVRRIETGNLSIAALRENEAAKRQVRATIEDFVVDDGEAP